MRASGNAPPRTIRSQWQDDGAAFTACLSVCLPGCPLVCLSVSVVFITDHMTMFIINESSIMLPKDILLHSLLKHAHFLSRITY